MNKLYQQKHELWLAITFASFSISDEAIKSRLYDFSLIAFRHMKWLGSDILESGGRYNYDRTMQISQDGTSFEIIHALQKSIQDIQDIYPQTILGDRIKTDDKYLLEYLQEVLSCEFNNQTITAFNRKREWGNKNLAQDQIDALTLFLFEESYKEYELILVYAYMQARTDDITHFNVFEDLIDESHFHLKSFGNMMAKLGILTIPLMLH
jgi:hypothetical protein